MNTLDKEEFRIKLEEINRLVEQQDYKEAMDVVDSIDWRRVKNVRTLCVVGEIYAANKRYEDSKEIFLLAYHRAPIGKNILYRLIEVSLKMKDIDEAMEFYEEYLEVASNDHTQYILKYKIYKAKKAPLEEQIKILEDYKDKEFTERWSYELAKLYYQAGENSKCLSLCNEMILWFNEGRYILKALELKNKMGMLSGAEKEKLEQQLTSESVYEEAAEADESKEGNSSKASVKVQEEDVPVIESVQIDQRDINNAESLQEKISKGIRDIFNSKKKEEDESVNGEENAEAEKIQEEMIKNISEKEELTDVPALEPEDIKYENKKTAEKAEEEPEEELDLAQELNIPDLDIPKTVKKAAPKDSLKMPELPKAPVIYIPEEDEVEAEKEEKSDDFDFNLEDTILAAASAQGIEIPKDPEPEKTAEPEFEDDDLDEPMTEEDLRRAEEEFLNGPAEKEEEPEIKPLVEEDEEDSIDISKKPAGMRTDVFLFQEEIKKIVKQQEEEEARKNMTPEEELEYFVDSINAKDEDSLYDIVPREKKMTDDEKKLFTYFAKVPGLTEQIVDALCDAQMAAADKTSKTGNIIVMGGRETGKTRLISSLIPAICKELNIEASKVAYVFADQINGKDIAAIVNKMAGGFLVIEDANQLTPETVSQLDKAMEFRTDGLIVIIEDEKIGMRKLIAKYPKFAKKFTSMINIPVFTNDELVNFAKVYTKEMGYRIDQMGMLALYNLIGINQKEDKPMNIGAVKELIDNAIAKSQGGIRKLKRNISKKRIDAEGYIVLYEKDFN